MIIEADALAFDMDGTLVDSRPMIAAVWAGWASRLGLDPDEVGDWAAGRSLHQVVTHFAPLADPRAEARTLIRATGLYEDHLRPLAGAAELLAALAPSEWALVTSAEPDLARRWMRICALPSPDVIVTAADVTATKPAPEPYLLAAAGLGCAPARMAAFEDSAAGLASATAAGMATVGIGGAAGALAGWPDFSGVRRLPGDGIRLERRPAPPAPPPVA